MRLSAFEPASYTGSGINDDLPSISSSSSGSSENAENSEFTKLKIERKEKRRNRRLARSVSGLNGSESRSPPESETLLLTELADASRLCLKNRRDESGQI